MRNANTVTALLIINLLFFPACHRPVKNPPGTLVIGLETGPTVLDPRYATDAVSGNVCGLIYSGLLRRNADGVLEPHLAQSVRQTDPLTYVIKLKPNISFHDGRPFTSADVKYTYDSVLDPASASPKRGALKEIKSIETPDDRTVIIKLKEPFAPFMGNLTLGIVPAGSQNLTGDPVGTGPFKYVDYYRGSSLFLVMNSAYFEGRPKIKALDFKILPDETVRLLQLKKGGVHLVQNPITPAVLGWLERQEGVKVVKKAGTNVSYIGFNMEDEILKNRDVRLAIAHALDRDAIIRYMLKGLAVRSSSLLAPSNPFLNDKLPSIEHDVEKAKKLLDKAGYPDPGDGTPRFSLTYKTSKNPSRKKIAEVFAQQLAEVGIDISIKSFEWGTFFSDIKKGNFQIYSLTWVGIWDPDIYRYIFHSSSLPPEGANRGRYMNARLDKLLDEGRLAQEFDERKAIYDEVQEIIFRDAPYVHLWTSVNVTAFNRSLKGFVTYPDESLDSLAFAEFSG